MSIETRLRRAADDAQSKITGLTPPTIRQHRRRAGLGWAVAGTAVVLLTVFIAPRLPTNPPTNTPDRTVSAWEVVDLEDASMVLSYPADWHLAEANLTPNLGDPREVFSLGSFPLEPGGQNCAQVPTRALHDMEATDVLLTVQERINDAIPSGFDRRPDNFGPTPDSANNVFYDCLEAGDRADVSAIHWIAFTDAGRYFYALVAIGSSADPKDVSAIWDTLDRLVILPTEVPASCPVTIPGTDGFVPSVDAPDPLPDLYDAVWYGTPQLWTMINPNGAIDDHTWLAGDKTFWWSKDFDEVEPDITITGRHLSGSAPTVTFGGPGTNGYHPTLGHFMLVGVQLPEPGCWELTAEYKGASLSYVLWFSK